MRRLSALALLGLASPVLATNGYFSHGYGTISKGMAGTGVAWSQDAIAAAANPAGMSFVEDRLDVGAEWFSPRREYEVEGGPEGMPPMGTFYLRPGTYESSSEHFVIPHFGYKRALDDKHTVGLTLFGNGGMNTDYDKDAMGPFYGGDAGVNLEQLFIMPSYSFQLDDKQAVGIAPIVAYQRFEAQGLAAFSMFSSDPANLNDNGTDESWGYGVQLGWQGRVSEQLRLGASYRSRIYMSEFDDYAGLFAEQGDFDIPPMLNVGLAWQGGRHHVLFDVQHVRYSEVDAVGNSIQPLLLQQSRLGDDNGAGFGWDDMTTYKLGYQLDLTNDTQLRAGVSYGEQPIPDEEVLFNILAPGVQEWHYTAGVTTALNDKWDISGMAFYSPEKEVEGENPLGPGQTIALRMYQIGASVSFAYKF